MAYSKIILNGETLIDVTSDTVGAESLLNGKTATKNDGTKVTGNIENNDSSDLTVSGAKVTAAAGYYPSAVSKSVATTTHPNPTATIASSTGVVTATHTQGTGYVTGGTTTGTLNLATQAAQTINTSTADRTIASNRWLTGTQTIKGVTTSNLTAANIAEDVVVKVGDANNASRITQITGTHKEGTPYTAMIYGNGDSNYCYVQYKGVKYYTDGQTFTFYPEDVIDFYAKSDVGIDAYIKFGAGTYASSTDGPATYSFTTIGCNIFIYISYGNTYGNNVGHIEVSFGNDTLSDARPELNLETDVRITPSTSTQYYSPTSGYYGFAGFRVASVPTGSAFPPAVTITKNPTINVNTSGVVTASYTGSSSITPTITSGYVSQGTAGTISTAGTSTYQLTSKAAATYYPSTADQTIASQRWLVGNQTIKSVTTSNLTAENIAEGVVVKVGDSSNASRITQVTGTHSGGDTSLEDAIITRNFISISTYTYENSRVKFIGEYAFATVKGLSSIYVPNVSTISAYAFYDNSYITYISAPKVEMLGVEAFYSCKNLSLVSFPLAESIPSRCFQECSKLQSVFFPSVTVINTCGFSDCSSLANIHMPNLQSCGYGGYYFRSCTNLSSVNFPNLYYVGSAMFNWCINLHTVSLGNSTITSARFNQSVFMVCRNLLSLYLYYGAVPSFGGSMFYGSPISDYTTSTGGVYGSIFVPSSLYNSYITATGWAEYSARIVSI